MRILLFGEYSNVHWTLAEGLKALGHDVVVVSNGDFWKDYPRDINLSRKPTAAGGIKYAADLLRILPRLRGFDIVQIINPIFLDLKANPNGWVYRYLRRHNRHMVMCGFGMDYYWVSTCLTPGTFEYSDFNIGPKLRTNADALKETSDWIGTRKEKLNKHIAADCDAIVTGLYEYWRCYNPVFPEKTTFIPFPVKCSGHTRQLHEKGQKIKLFIGINKTRNEYKGTDIMLRAAQDMAAKHADRVELAVAESVSFDKYTRMMDGSDAILDQLYSYTPAMNALQAMSKGIICIGGGEKENYEILGEDRLRPIVNVKPTYESVCNALENLVDNPENIATLQRQSMEYVKKHHDYMKVARQYESVYRRLMQKQRGGKKTVPSVSP